MKTSIVSILKLAVASLVFLATTHAMAQDKATTKKKVEPQNQVQININTADKAELETLPRIGPATADRIIDFRDRHGGFKRIEELLNVKGIGPKTFERLKDRVCL